MYTETSRHLPTFTTVPRLDVEHWLRGFESQMAWWGWSDTDCRDLYDLLKTGRDDDGSFTAHHKVIEQMLDALHPKNRGRGW
jgi:hypothetical protein